MLKIVTTMLLIFLSGCAVNPYGNFVDDEDTQDEIRNNILEILSNLHPPAKTQFSLIHEVKPKDYFGFSLINEMRMRGYGIQEYSKKQETTGILLGYTLDIVDSAYRITLYVNEQRLSRPFLLESGSVIPGGSWSLKE